MFLLGVLRLLIIHRAPQFMKRIFSSEKIIISGFFHSRNVFPLIVKDEQY